MYAWSHVNPTAMSMREMGPGHHCDTLDGHFAKCLAEEMYQYYHSPLLRDRLGVWAGLGVVLISPLPEKLVANSHIRFRVLKYHYVI